MDDIADVIQFLSLESNVLIRGACVEYLVGVSGTPNDGSRFFTSNLVLLKPMVAVCGDAKYPDVAQQMWKALINLAAMDHKDIDKELLDGDSVATAVTAITDPKSIYADEAAMFLGNITRSKVAARKVLECKVPGELGVIASLADIFCRGPAFNKEAKFHHLAHVLFNVTQIDEARGQIMLRAGEGCVFQRLLPFTAFTESKARRGGVVGCIRNCCFTSSNHEWLLGPEVDILPHLLLPLIGPEELDDEDMDGMPDELQYQPPDKEREAEPAIRKHLLESLMQLCDTRFGRTAMRDQKVYPVLKHYHIWEPNEDLQQLCTDVVQVLITPEMEDEVPTEDGTLRDAEIPDGGLAPSGGEEEEKRVFHVGAPEGVKVTWRPDYKKAEIDNISDD
eukprot:m.459665 g.459665  ORF g.459665 m.459665 type:complete len:392 (+) comp21806_c0_seq1:276-1451(+)